MASSSASSSDTVGKIVPTGTVFVTYSFKNYGDKTDELKKYFAETVGSCTGEAPQTIQGSKTGGVLLLRFEDVKHAGQAEFWYDGKKADKTLVKIYNFDKKGQVYVGLTQKKNKLHLIVETLTQQEIELK